MIATAVLLLTLAADPRIPLVELLLQERPEEALERVDQLLVEQPEEAHRLGLSYLRGDLLSTLGDDQAAARAFAVAPSRTPVLSLHGLYRLALEQERLGHPELAAGLISRVVASGPPEPLATEAVLLLARTLARGGDCQLLNPIEPARLPKPPRRRYQVIQGDCALASRRPEQAAELYLGLLRDGEHDEAERLAAERISEHLPRVIDTEVAERLGLAFHQHRDFERAIDYLEPVVQGFEGTLRERRFQVAYTLVRSFFWMERYAEAAERYGWLARRTPEGETRARTFYQQARSFELHSKRTHASESYRAAYRADPEGRWADAALFSMMRIEWRNDEDETDALKLYEALKARSSWRSMTARAALFLASSELVRGRADRAGAWLTDAARADRDVQIEVDYWRGRLEELAGAPERAVSSYLSVLRRSRHHPLGQAARGRLELSGLAETARRRGLALVTSASSGDLYDAWLLLGSETAAGRGALDRLRQRLTTDRTAAPSLAAEWVPPASWPLWQRNLDEPEEMLLALGVFRYGAPAVGEHFSVSDPSLGLTGGLLLARGGEIRRSIRQAEILERRVPGRVPEVLLPAIFRRLLYPLAHREVLEPRAARFGADPLLLAAIIREESRYDARALSPASARGLTQFVQPTAERVARRIGRGRISPEDLYRPELAISLGAAYLGELLGNFDGATEVAVASYNAGEPQARLWRSYCFSMEPEEYYTKVSFQETRGYLTKVLSSWSQYREIYARP